MRPPELELLTLAARGRCTAEDERLAALFRAVTSWPELLDVAERHGLVPLLHHHLASAPPGWIPDAAHHDLGERFRAAAGRSLALTCELGRLVQLSRSAGVSAVPFKGPALASTAHGQIALRAFRDLDLLVAKPDLERVLKSLEMSGYERMENAARPERAYHVALQHEESQAVVELHWALSPPHYPIALGMKELRPHLVTVEVGGVRMPSLDPAATLLVACVHGGRHLWRHLLWIADVAGLVRRHGADLPWSDLAAMARRAGCRRLLGVGLALAERLFDAALPTAARSALRRQDRAWASRLEQGLVTPPTPRQRHLQLLGLRERWRDRWPYLNDVLRRR